MPPKQPEPPRSGRKSGRQTFLHSAWRNPADLSRRASGPPTTESRWRRRSYLSSSWSAPHDHRVIGSSGHRVKSDRPITRSQLLLWKMIERPPPLVLTFNSQGLLNPAKPGNGISGHGASGQEVLKGWQIPSAKSLWPATMNSVGWPRNTHDTVNVSKLSSKSGTSPTTKNWKKSDSRS